MSGPRCVRDGESRPQNPPMDISPGVTDKLPGFHAALWHKANNGDAKMM